MEPERHWAAIRPNKRNDTPLSRPPIGAANMEKAHQHARYVILDAREKSPGHLEA